VESKQREIDEYVGYASSWHQTAVRLQSEDMKLFYSDHVTLPLPEGHRFPMPKYQMLHQQVRAATLVPLQDLRPAPPAKDEEILRVHLADYWEKVISGTLSEKEIRRIGFPWSPGLVERTRRSVGGTLAACRAALQEGFAANLAGGTHHAYPDHGEGYCVLNDVAIAARVMQGEGLAQRVVILDCDVHQGNGTAAIFANDPSVFTFSMHGERNFPFHKEASDLDIALPDGCDDAAFLEQLQIGLDTVMRSFHADLGIYIAGADPFHDDRLGKLALTKAGLLERDRLVFERCMDEGLPLAIVMGGGYARNVEDTVEIQYQTIRLATEMADKQ
jgi:acetoin utilization deacetylase AcuC-like enzyme